MNIDSANINPSRPDNSRTTGTKSEATSRSAQAGTASGSTEQKAGDSVSLSSSAKTLTQVEATLKSASDVDIDRVDAVKAKIDSGEYTIDNENLAQKLLDIES